METNKHRYEKNNNGFTLVEVMAVVVILGVLAGIVVPSVTGYIDKSKKSECEIRRSVIMNEYTTYSRLYGQLAMSDVLAGTCQYIDISKYSCPSGGKYTYAGGELLCSVHSDSSFFTSGDKHGYAEDLIAVWDDYLKFVEDSNATLRADGDGMITYNNNKQQQNKTNSSIEDFLKTQLGIDKIEKQNFENMKIVLKDKTATYTDVSKATVASVYYKIGAYWYIIYADTGNKYKIANNYGSSKNNWSEYVRDESHLVSLIDDTNVWKE